jgi:hypothetical protein
MKKLLALILCVMMFVAVIPTSAFALTGIKYDGTFDNTTVTGWTSKEWAGKMAATKAVEDISTAVKNMYGSIAANQGVFNTVVAIDDTIKSMADNMFKDIDELVFAGYTFSNNKDITDATKTFLKQHIGSEITKYLDEHKASFTDKKTLKDGTTKVDVIDPVKYMNAFATAASKAMTSEKAVKNIEALAYTGAYATAYKEAKDKMDDLYNDYQSWDGKFSDYGWDNITSARDWEPYVFMDSMDPFYDSYGVAGGTDNSNIYTTLNDWYSQGTP